MREALFQLTQIINAIRFFRGELHVDEHLALYHYSSYYGVVLNPSLGNHQPPAPPDGHPLSNVVYVYDKSGEQIAGHYQWLDNSDEITEEVALTWWSQIREYIVPAKSDNRRLAAMVEFYKGQIADFESSYSSKSSDVDKINIVDAKTLISKLSARHCAELVYQLILLSNALRLKKGELDLSEWDSASIAVYNEYADECLRPALGDAYSPLSPPELGNPHAMLWSTYGKLIARIYYYNSHGRANGTEYSELTYVMIWKLIRDQILKSDNRRVVAFCVQFSDGVSALESTYQNYVSRDVFLGVEISPEAMEELQKLRNT